MPQRFGPLVVHLRFVRAYQVGVPIGPASGPAVETAIGFPETSPGVELLFLFAKDKWIAAVEAETSVRVGR
jgi:hypothetical protein